MTDAAPKVYAAIAAVMSDVSKEGVGKTRRNQQQGYNFRGIDDVYNALAPSLAKHKLIVLPRVLSRELVERQTAKGGVLFYVTVEVEFDFVSGEDGSRHVAKTYGEAMDSADKATNKAMSAAFKYVAMQTFCIPTEGDNDADAVTHDVAPRQQAAAQQRPSPHREPAPDDFPGDLEPPKQTLAERSASFITDVQACPDAATLNMLVKCARAVKLDEDLNRTDPDKREEIMAAVVARFDDFDARKAA